MCNKSAIHLAAAWFLVLLLTGLHGCKKEKSGTCGNGKIGLEEECDCGMDPDRLPPGCTDINGGEEANCTSDCRRSVNETGALCSNGVDDDDDGSTDCDDPGCSTYFRCLTEDCSNGLDDNGDGLTDCDDLQCSDSIECLPEDCTNGLDDNNDAHTDCQDEECLGHPDCSGVEICWNHIDDNDDGRTDCEEPDCAADYACLHQENPSNGNCNDGVDNDTDGWTDCADPGCFGQESCTMSSCVRDDLATLPVVGSFQQLTVDVGDDPSQGDLDDPCGVSMGREKIIEIQMGETGRLMVAYRQQERHSYGLYFPAGLERPCTDALFACRTPTGNDRFSGVLDFGIRQAGSYFLIVAEASQYTAGVVELTVSCVDQAGVEICGNWVDDDNDGTIDCGDLDCRETAGLCDDSDCQVDLDLGTIPSVGYARTAVVNVADYGLDNKLSCLSTGSEDLVIGFLKEDDQTEIKVGYDQSMPGGGDHVFGLFFRGGAGTDCDAAEHACFDPLGAGRGVFDLGVLPSGQYYLVAKGRSQASGNLQLTVSSVPAGGEICDNGFDDNADGLVDCEDSTRCGSFESCLVEQCGNGIDDDFDGKTDCLDDDADDICSCTFSCNSSGTCDGGQSGQVDHDPEIIFLGACNRDEAFPSGTVDLASFYGPGLPAADDYLECASVNHDGGTPDAVLYFTVLQDHVDVIIEWDNREQGVFHLAELRSADQCAACDSGTFWVCHRSPDQNTYSGTWYFVDVQPGDYVLLIARDTDYDDPGVPNYHLGPMDYTITCQSRVN